MKFISQINISFKADVKSGLSFTRYDLVKWSLDAGVLKFNIL